MGCRRKNDKQKKAIEANMVEVPSHTRLSQYRRSSTPLMLDFRYRAGVDKSRPNSVKKNPDRGPNRDVIYTCILIVCDYFPQKKVIENLSGFFGVGSPGSQVRYNHRVVI